MKEFVIGANDADQRLDKFIRKVTVDLPSALLYKALRKNGVKVNGKRREGAYRLQEGDQVKLWLPDEFFTADPASFLTLTAFPQVVFEDAQLLVVHKPVGLSCHSDSTQQTGTLIDRILAYLYQKGEYDPAQEQSFAPALCNRIDRNTAGLVICAKTAVALREMNLAIRDRLPEKEYLALVWGKVSAQHGRLQHYLKKDSDTNTVQVFDRPHPGALTALSEYWVQAYHPREPVTRLRIRLHTGRTHQIRAQFAHVGHPLVGDGKYGRTGGKKQLGFAYQALLSHSLTLHFPPQSPLAYLDGVHLEAQIPPEFSF